jgi:bacteriocin-like protein
MKSYEIKLEDLKQNFDALNDEELNQVVGGNDKGSPGFDDKGPYL